MKLDYLSLLSFEPLVLYGIGSIKAPLLKEIAAISYGKYLSYLSVLSLTAKTYYQMIEQEQSTYLKKYSEEEITSIFHMKAQFESEEDQTKKPLFFDIIQCDSFLLHTLTEAFNFFMNDTVCFVPEKKTFFLYNGSVNKDGTLLLTGIINRDNYPFVTELILQRNGYRGKKGSDNQIKFKNKLAEKLYNKLQKAEQKKCHTDEKLKLPNLISALAANHNSLNLLNIWDLTVYQLYDQFHRQEIQNHYAISSMSVAAWGDPKGTFDVTEWFHPITD